jgi:Lrp/AsnC family transcriptional regulator, leucine-responsive regulatory protein
LLDQKHITILVLLQQDGRRHLAEIAKEVELSSPAVMERLKKLESRGIIKAFHAILDAKKLGKNITAFIGVSVSHQRYIDHVGLLIAAQKDVLECHHVTGPDSFVLKVTTTDTASLEKLIAEIRSMEGVTRTVTNVVLSTSKESSIIPLDTALEESFHKESPNGEATRRFTGTLGKK